MNLSTKHYGSYGGKKSSVIQLTVTDWGGNSLITEDVTDLHGRVDTELIEQLRQIADELEEQNNLVDKESTPNK